MGHIGLCQDYENGGFVMAAQITAIIIFLVMFALVHAPHLLSYSEYA